MKLRIQAVFIGSIVVLSVVWIISAFFHSVQAPIEDVPKTVDSNLQADTNMDEEDPLKNEFSHIVYYDKQNLTRYKTYQKGNPALSIEDIITHVNMGIDAPFYSKDPIIIENPDRIDVLVNKIYKLPESWKPSDLVAVESGGQQMRSEAAQAFQLLKEDCKVAGFNIIAHSAYRSTKSQKHFYDNMLAINGEEYTDKYMARPGHSEHTTGLAADISINGAHYTKIENSEHYPTFYALLENHGFIVRYPQGKEHLTGYAYEAWHIRYIGKDLAKQVNALGITYDEYVARKGE